MENEVAIVSYVLVIFCLGRCWLSASIYRINKLRHSRKHADHHHSSHSDEKEHLHQHSHSHSHGHSNGHESGCGCSHTHVQEENQSVWRTLTVILSMGFRPCSGAIVVLIYAHLVDVYFYGVIATLMMGVGTGLSVSLIAIAAQYARSWLERFATASNKISIYSKLSISNYVRFIGGAFLVVFGWSLYSTATTITFHQHLFQ